MQKFSRVENSSACRATCSCSWALTSSVPITRPQSASTSCSAFDRAFRSDSRAFRANSRALRYDTKALRSNSRATKDSWSTASVSAKDVRNPASISA